MTMFEYSSAIDVYEKVLSFDKNNTIARDNLLEARHKKSIEGKLAEERLETEFTKLVISADEDFQNQDDAALITMGTKLALLLSKCINVRYGLTKTCIQVVSAHLTLGTVNEALDWVDKINIKVNVSPIKERLLEIREIQGEGDFILEDIQDDYMLNRLAALYKTLLSYRKAISIYQRSLHINKDNIYTYNGIGGNYKELGQYDVAIDYYTKGYKTRSNYASLNGIGAAYRKKGNHNDALNFYNEVLENNPSNKFANNGIGAVYFDLGMYDIGSQYFNVAADAKHLLGLFYEYRDNSQLDTALECLKLILRKDPGHSKASYLIRHYCN